MKCILSMALGRHLFVIAGLALASTMGSLSAADTYYVSDHLATTTAVANATGEIASLEADAFGSPVSGEPAARYTGKPYDSDMGAYVFPFRNYRSDEARWMSADPSGFPDGRNSTSYITRIFTYSDPLGLSGWLTVHSSGMDGSETISGVDVTGHSWISYLPDATAANPNPTTTTYGTFGNENGGQGVEGLNTNSDFEVASGQGAYSRTVWVSDSAESTMYSVIAEYALQGAGAWSPLSPCSSFAANIWNTTTGENLTAGVLGTNLISTPLHLANSIYAANGNRNHGTTHHE